MTPLCVRAEPGDATVAMEATGGRDYRAWSLLGDVELRADSTFLTLGYLGTRPEPGTPPSHVLTVGVDQSLGLHALLSAALQVGLPKSTRVELFREQPPRRPAPVDATTGYASQGAQVTAAWDSAGLSDVEFGGDASVAVTRYPLSRELTTTTATGAPVRYTREDVLWAARPAVGGRLLLGTHWELGARGGLTLYSEDPLSAGQFTSEEEATLSRRLENAVEARRLLRRFQSRINRDLGAALSRRLADVNATAGIPTAPARFDLRPSLTWKPGPGVRGQLAYAFTRYVAGEGHSHLVSTRWTVRLGAPLRVWAAVALQQDVREESSGEDAGDTPPRNRSGMVTLGGEYTF
ncbi:hypothetical protein LZ198_06940 [Myxococcus sp. K15C18031901]|uniref:hypothetical protein n=1 Tax=Myxococcus dinghuensis TaxID=2906761 RepID=UPI0020A74A46|nr:hypothetical protein [Myxococcus dinghuensis]MCP3098610.1 hypothetical protein [Myxococcus dinghuensis]